MISSVLLFTSLLVLISALYIRHRKSSTVGDLVTQARERAEQRKIDRAFMDTAPNEDPYNRVYNFSDDMSVVEVDETANGHGILDDEQRRIISTIFDNKAQVASEITTAQTGIVRGARDTYGISSKINQVDRVTENDIWAGSRK